MISLIKVMYFVFFLTHINKTHPSMIFALFNDMKATSYITTIIKIALWHLCLLLLNATKRCSNVKAEG